MALRRFSIINQKRSVVVSSERKKEPLMGPNLRYISYRVKNKAKPPITSREEDLCWPNGLFDTLDLPLSK